jgi:hypothetical protein
MWRSREVRAKFRTRIIARSESDTKMHAMKRQDVMVAQGLAPVAAYQAPTQPVPPRRTRTRARSRTTTGG